MASRITGEWAVQIGLSPDGTAETRSIGYEVEDDFGGGNKTTRLLLCLDVLNPVLFALARGHVTPRSGHAQAVRRDYAKRYKDPGAVAGEEADAEGKVWRVTKEWVLQVGETTTGTAEVRAVGFEVEAEGDGETRLKLCLDVLSPVLYQLVKGHVPAKAAHVYAVREVRVTRARAGGPGAAEVAAANGAG